MNKIKSLFLILTITIIILPFQNFDITSQTASSNPTLNDLFENRAVFQTLEESEEITINFGAPRLIYDQKLNIIFNPSNNVYYAFTREHRKVIGNINEKIYKVAVLVSSDGINFRRLTYLFSDLFDMGWNLYDMHVTFTGTEYIMTMECAYPGVVSSVCISKTTTPFNFSSWSRPKLIVQSSHLKSASTGATLFHNNKLYLKWTVIDEDKKAPYKFNSDGERVYLIEDGQESTYTKAIELHKNLNDDQFIYVGESTNVGKTILPAEPRPLCTNGWDCNNLDIQDWKQEGQKIYAIYNGGNFYRCHDPVSDPNNNKWALAIRRSDSPLGNYSESTGILIQANDTSRCGISYPTINILNNQIYMYYSYYDANDRDPHGNSKPKIMRSKLNWIQTQTSRANPLPSLERSYSINIDTSDNNIIERIEKLYVILLNRYPTAEETQIWVSVTRRNGFKNAVQKFLLSKEHLKKWQNRSTNLKIKSLYQSLLLRNPDLVGIDTFNTLILNNTPAQNIFNAILNSKEFLDKTPN